MVIRKTNEDAGASSNAMLGLSGLDTASMLKSMMAPYKKPIELTLQKQQLVIWRQERYREFIDKLNDFESKFFDYSKPASNLLSEGTLKKFAVQNSGSEYVKIKATGSAKQGSGSIEIHAMPAAAKLQGSTGILSPVKSMGAPDWTQLANRSFAINMEGLERAITIPTDIASVADPYAAIQDAVDRAFGAGQIIVDNDGGGGSLRFTPAAGVGNISIISNDSDTSYYLRFTSDANHSNRVNLDSTLSAISNRLNAPIAKKTVTVTRPDGSSAAIDVVQFSINGKSFQFDVNTHMSAVIDAVNNDADAKVTMKYDVNTGAFSIASDVCGLGDNVSIVENETGFFSAIGLGLKKEASGARHLDGGVIDPYFVATANSVRASAPYEINVVVDGVDKTVTLDNASGGYVDYVTPDDVLADINAQLSALFPDSGLSVSAVPVGGASPDWKLSIDVSAAAASKPGAIAVFPPAGMSAADAETLFAAIGIADLPRFEKGAYGKVTIDGTNITVDRKDFEYEGVVYELAKATEPGSPVAFEVTADIDEAVKTITEFVDAYNSLLAMLNGALGEARYGEGGGNEFQPLTDAQRAEMSETEIEKWEAKSKLGLLRGDSIFISLTTKIRMSAFNPIYTACETTTTDSKTSTSFGSLLGANFETIGIFTDKYEEKGELHINAEKLRYALETDMDSVAKVFSASPPTLTQEATESDAQFARRQKSVNEKMGGIAYKLFAVMEEYVRTSRDANGAKGLLVSRAGKIKDQSEADNAFSREILTFDKKINSLWDRYDRIESAKIKQLSKLETYVSNASAQMSWLTSQLSGG